MTNSEQRLVKMWTACAHGGDWFELNRTLHEIAMVLICEGHDKTAELFNDASNLALRRYVDTVIQREAA